MKPDYSFAVDYAFALADELESANQQFAKLKRPCIRERMLPIVCHLEEVYERVDELAALTFKKTPSANADAVTDAAILLQKQKRAIESLVQREFTPLGRD